MTGIAGSSKSSVPTGATLVVNSPASPCEPRTRPLAYLSEGGHIYVFAGNRGAPTNPNWYHNLVAHPDVAVELGTEKFEARATVIESTEWDRLGRIQVQKLPGLAELAAKVTRKVPVILLERKKERERLQEKRRDL